MVALIVFAVGLVAALAAATWSILSRDHDPVDPQTEERWLIRVLRDHPRLAAFARRRLDRSTAGGLLLTVSLAFVFLAATGVGLVFDMVDENRGFARWDESAARWGARNATAASTWILRVLTDFGGTEGIVIVTLIIGAWGFWRFRNLKVFAFMTVIAAGQSLLNNGLKWIVMRDRPDFAQLAGHAGSSFPSGHSAAAAATWAAVALVLGRGRSRRVQAALAGVAVLIATLVAASRVLLGVHWLTDVIAGVFVGWGWFIVAGVAFGGRILRLGEPLERADVVEDDPAGRHADEDEAVAA